MRLNGNLDVEIMNLIEFKNVSFSYAIDDDDENHVTVFPVTTAEYGMSKAARPFNSRLDKSKLVEAGFTPLPDWKDALQRYLKEVLQ